jgi:hypothetical protein
MLRREATNMLRQRALHAAFAGRPARPARQRVARQRVAPGHGGLAPAAGSTAHGGHVPRGGAIPAGVCHHVLEAPTDARGFTPEGAGSCASRC